jgi:hypothetical protein
VVVLLFDPVCRLCTYVVFNCMRNTKILTRCVGVAWLSVENLVSLKGAVVSLRTCRTLLSLLEPERKVGS